MDGTFIVTGIGELLWDVFPEGRRLGGAPVNFCYHCHQLGATGYPVSAVGRDDLGNEILSALAERGMDARYVAPNEHPTGTVQVTLENGKPRYEICEGVAWDYIPMTKTLGALAEITNAVCFGSLAQRNPASRAAIHEFFGLMKPDALKIFDVNLRQTFFSKEIVETSLAHCAILKLSDEELPVLAELFGLTGATEEQLERLREMFGLQLIAYTRGPDGSRLVADGETDDHPGCPGAAVNSVGAGDSFTAALCMGLLNKKPLDEINDHANRVATFVCSQDSATPVIPRNLREG